MVPRAALASWTRAARSACGRRRPRGVRDGRKVVRKRGSMMETCTSTRMESNFALSHLSLEKIVRIQHAVSSTQYAKVRSTQYAKVCGPYLVDTKA